MAKILSLAKSNFAKLFIKAAMKDMKNQTFY
jgi:hypothetical protein